MRAKPGRRWGFLLEGALGEILEHFCSPVAEKSPRFLWNGEFRRARYA